MPIKGTKTKGSDWHERRKYDMLQRIQLETESSIVEVTCTDSDSENDSDEEARIESIKVCSTYLSPYYT